MFGTRTVFVLLRGNCGVEVERIIEPRHSGPAGGGWMKSDVGQRKYVLEKDMPELDKYIFSEKKRKGC